MRSRRRREVARFSEPQWREEQPITAAVTSRHSANQRPRCRHSGPGRECRRGTWNRSPGCQMLYVWYNEIFPSKPYASDRKYKNIFTRKIFVAYSRKLFSTAVKSVFCKGGEGKSEWESRMRSVHRLVAGCQSCRGRAGPGPLPAAACVVQLSVAAVLATVASSDLHQLPTLNHPPSPRHHRSATLGAAPFCDPGASQNKRTHFEVTLYNCERERTSNSCFCNCCWLQ